MDAAVWLTGLTALVGERFGGPLSGAEASLEAGPPPADPPHNVTS